MISPIHNQRAASIAWLVVMCCACGIAAADPGGTSVATPTDGPQPSDEQIAAWITELDSNRYLERERATQQLLDANTAALGPLLVAANSDRPEPADRAVWILRRLASSDDLAVRQQALEHLVQVNGRPQVVAEAIAARAKIRHDIAVRAIEELGGRYLSQGDDEYWRQTLPNRVVFDARWRGGDAGLELLGSLQNVPMVIVVGTDISPAGFEQLAAVQSLRYVRLYGTRLQDADVVELRKKLHGVEIDYRRGGFLGVEGGGTPQMAVVSKVRPGSAAAVAGIREGDIIRKFDGKSIANFVELTGEIAKHGPGDEVTLEILRGESSLDVAAKLGRWETP